MFHLGQIRQCIPPYFRDGATTFHDDAGNCNPCPAGMVWSATVDDCVISVDVVGNPPPATTGSNTWMYLAGGALLLLLLGFTGGRSTRKSSKAGSRLISRTTTKSVFA